MAYGRTNAGGATLDRWKFTSASALPTPVTKHTFTALTDTAVTSTVIDSVEPATPAAGMLWWRIEDPTDGMAMSDCSVPFRCVGAYQYVSGAWTLKDSYYSYLETWREVLALPPVGTTLENCTWDQINRIGAAGKAADYFCVGDEKTVALTTAEVITLRIIDFAHDNLAVAGGGNAPITFDMKDCLATKARLNAGASSVGGYSGCELYPTLTNTIFNTLPEDLRNVIKQVSKNTTVGNSSASLTTTTEKIFLLSEVEVDGATTASFAGEGTQYALYATGASRIKRVGAAASCWWTRSPYSTGFCFFSESGGAYGPASGGANGQQGVSFGLCV